MLIRKRPWIPLLLLLLVLVGWLGLVEAIKGDGGGLNRHGNGNRLGRGRHLTDDNNKDNKDDKDDKDNKKKEAKKVDGNDDNAPKKGAKGAHKEPAPAAKAVKKQEVSAEQQGGGDKENKDKTSTPEPVTASPSVAPTDSGKVVVVGTTPTSAPSKSIVATNEEANKTDPPANVVVVTEGDEVCGKATNCQECLERGKEVSAKDVDSSCSWLNEACTKAEARTIDTATMCSTVKVDTSQEVTPPATETDDTGGGGGFPYGFMFLIVMVAGLYVGRERAIKAMNDILARSRSGGGASSFGGGNNDMGSVFSGSFGSSTKSSTYRQERVPLTTATTTADDDEEWGWENSIDSGGGEVELSNRKNEDDLNFALTSSSLSRASPTKTSGLRSSSSSSTAPSGLRTATTGGGGGASPSSSSLSHKRMGQPKRSGSGGSWSSGATPGAGGTTTAPAVAPTTTTTATTPSISSMQIKSLGKKSLPKKKPVVKKKKSPEDDLFASMGLAAKPTFKPKPKPTTTTTSSSVAWKASSSTTPDAQWDDDGDLDDLLND